MKLVMVKKNSSFEKSIPKNKSNKVGLEQDSTKPSEIGGRSGLDPTRFGDWEKDGRCVDF